jgi:nucleoside-diphosphate-sugar epimerase
MSERVFFMETTDVSTSSLPAILLTGSTGYLGGLAAARLLASTEVPLVLPVRERHTRETVLDSLRAILRAEGKTVSEERFSQVVVLPLPPMEALDRLRPELEKLNVQEIVHCAACLDYFDKAALKAVNIDFTRALLELGRELNIRRFIYISTAFSCGYTEGAVPERLHPEPSSDPMEYTRSKRQAEWLVGESGLPYLILRPSIVIGDSRDGRYGGKPYGIYQVVGGYERLLCDRYLPTLHAVAPRTKLQLLHQDAFQEAFFAAYRECKTGSIVNLVSDQEKLPTVRDLFEVWMEICTHPQEVYFYSSLKEIPLDRIDSRQRILLEFVAANVEIASHPWVFETDHLNRLRSRGLSFADATMGTLRICLEWFIASSPRIQTYLQRHRDLFPAKPKMIEIPRSFHA